MTFDIVARDALNDVGHLLTSEFGTRSLRNDFAIGAGYDILLRDADRFRYASPVVYTVISVPVDSRGELLGAPSTLGMVVSRVVGECNIQQSWYRQHNAPALYDVHITTPIIPGDPRVLSRVERRLSALRRPLKFSGDYLVAIIQFATEGLTWPPCAYIAARNPEWWSGDAHGVTVQGAHIRILAEAVARDLKRRTD